MKSFEEIFKESDKVHHHAYHLFYEDELNHMRDDKFKMLEIGYGNGESFPAWLEYFPKAQVDRGEVFCVDQSDESKLKKFARNKKYRFIIDDGSHVPRHQVTSFYALFPKLEYGGIYIIEDIETSFWHPDAMLYGYQITPFNLFSSEFMSDLMKLTNHMTLKHIKNRKTPVSSFRVCGNTMIIKKQTKEEQKYFNERKYPHEHLLLR
jgi:hypothetical protein